MNAKAAFDRKYLPVFSKRFKAKYNQWKKANKYQVRNQTEFANRVMEIEGSSCGKNSISDYLNGRTVPTVDRLKTLAQVLGCEVSELMPFGHDDLYKYSPEYMNEFGDQLTRYAQKIGLDLFFLRGLKEIVPDYGEYFPLFSPIVLNTDSRSFGKTPFLRVPPGNSGDSANMDVHNEIFQFQRRGETITLSPFDVLFLKDLQDEIVSFVQFRFYQRRLELKKEPETINTRYKEIMYQKYGDRNHLDLSPSPEVLKEILKGIKYGDIDLTDEDIFTDGGGHGGDNSKKR